MRKKFTMTQVLLGLAYLAADEESEEERELGHLLEAILPSDQFEALLNQLPATFDITASTVYDSINRLVSKRSLYAIQSR